MNLQFSLSTNVTGTSSTTSNIKGESRSNQDSDLLQMVRNGTDLSRLEQQGVAIAPGEEHLIKAIDKAIKALTGPTTTLEMSVHEKTHQILVKVLNKETGELIREIPPEKTLDLVAKMMEIAGIVIDQKV
ncbi:flagellar protein FlaG [Paenibacillus silvae]|uniref:flagellar protein FlaG n=1 Tax=Paenibacillus silvae TaxID=1325358 RepID=UPI003CF4A208